MADIRIYTMSFVDKNNGEIIYPDNIIAFFQKLEALMEEDSDYVYRRINGKLMRAHAYEWSDWNDNYVIIPFGILKESDKPLGVDKATQRLKDIPIDMFDVNCFAYHSRFQVAVLTTNKPGPTESNIENYLNKFFPPEFSYKIELNRLKRDSSIHKARNTNEARSLILTLDLGRPLNDFLLDQVNEEYNLGLASLCKSFADVSKEELDSRVLKIELGLGEAKKESMDVNAIFDLLDSINLDSEAIKEIAVKYRDERTKELDTVFLRNNSAALSIAIDYKGRISPEVLKYQLEERLREVRASFYDQVRDHFTNAIPMRSSYELIKERITRQDSETSEELALVEA